MGVFQMSRCKFLSILVTLFALMPFSARAQCDGCVAGAVYSSATALGTAIGAQTLILGRGLGGIIGAIKGNAQSIGVAVAKSADLIARKNTETAFSVEQIKNTYEQHMPGKCAAVAPAKGAIVSYNSPGDGNPGGGRGGSYGRGGGGMATSRAIANGLMPAPQAEAQAVLAVKEACSQYAAGAVRPKACTDAGLGGANASGFPNADIRAETIVDGPQKSETQTVRRLTVDPAEAGSTAIDDYMRNLDTPIQLRALTPAEASSQGGRQYLSFYDSYEARMSLATKPLRVLNANHAPSSSLIDVLKTMIVSTTAKNFLPAYLAARFPKWQSLGVSQDEYMNIEVLRRYANADYLTTVSTMSSIEIQREQLLATSFTNALLWRLVQSTELNGVVSSQAVAASVRAEMTPQLNALHANAVKR